MNTLSLITIAVGFLAPLVVGLLTKLSMPSSVKAGALLAINAAVALGQQYINHPGGSIVVALKTAVLGFVISVALHYGLLSKVGLTSYVQGLLVKDPELVQPDVSSVPDAAAVQAAIDAAASAVSAPAAPAAPPTPTTPAA